MSEVPLRRRIPPKPAWKLAAELMNSDADISQHDAHILAVAAYEHAMEEIYRLARLGETFERMRECPGGDLPYWRGYGDGWNEAQRWVYDNVED